MYFSLISVLLFAVSSPPSPLPLFLSSPLPPLLSLSLPLYNPLTCLSLLPFLFFHRRMSWREGGEGRNKTIKEGKGKNIPLDFPGEVRLVVTRGGTAVTQRTYISHSATCPNADEPRKKKGA